MNKQQKFKTLTTSKDKRYEQAQFEFALLCAERTIKDDTSEEVKTYFNLVALMRESTNFKTIEHLKDSDYRSAYWVADQSAYRAAYWAADQSAYRAAYRAADRAADWAADQVAYWAAYRAAERQVQYDIASYVWNKWELE